MADDETPSLSELPLPPGKKNRQPEAPAPVKSMVPEEKPKNFPASGSKSSGFNKIYYVAGAVLGLLFILLLLKPSKGTHQETPTPAAEDSVVLRELQGLKIKDQELSGKITILEGKIKLAEDKANAYEVGISTLKTSLEENQKKATENRNYISTIYRQVLDLELKVDAVGGGYKDLPGKEPAGRVVNPFIGSSELP